MVHCPPILLQERPAQSSQPFNRFTQSSFLQREICLAITCRCRYGTEKCNACAGNTTTLIPMRMQAWRELDSLHRKLHDYCKPERLWWELDSSGGAFLDLCSGSCYVSYMIILSNEEVESLRAIKTCIEALEKAYASWDKGTAINRPRTDLVMPSANEAGVYAFKSMEAGLYDPPIVAMRINSDIIRWNQQGNRTIKTKIPAAPGDKYVGLVMLFSTITGEPLAMFPDGVVQRMRVASSSALAARYLAREDASTLALFGSGWQAGSHLPAICAVRPIKRVNVFSPTQANLDAFVKDLQPKVSAEVRAAESPEAAVDRKSVG